MTNEHASYLESERVGNLRSKSPQLLLLRGMFTWLLHITLCFRPAQNVFNVKRYFSRSDFAVGWRFPEEPRTLLNIATAGFVTVQRVSTGAMSLAII